MVTQVTMNALRHFFGAYCRKFQDTLHPRYSRRVGLLPFFLAAWHPRVLVEFCSDDSKGEEVVDLVGMSASLQLTPRNLRTGF